MSPYFAIVTVCTIVGSSNVPLGCASTEIEESYRTLSDCMIEVERLDQSVRRSGMQVTDQTCRTDISQAE